MAIAEVSDSARRFHAVSLAAGAPGQITSRTEYWGKVGAARSAPPTRPLVIGATGSIGRPLVTQRLACGHADMAQTRDAARARAILAGARMSAAVPTDAVGASLLSVPPYTSDFNLIENAWAKRKAMLHKATERTIDGLRNAICRIIDTVPPCECGNYLAAAGHEPD